MRLIVKEEVEAAVEASETRMKDHISDQIKSSQHHNHRNGQTSEPDFYVGHRFSSVHRRCYRNTSDPRCITTKRCPRTDEKIEAQQQQIEALEKEMETYRQDRIVGS